MVTVMKLGHLKLSIAKGRWRHSTYTQRQQATFERATVDGQRLSSLKTVVEAYAHGMRNFPLATMLLLPVHSVVHSQLATAVTVRDILAYSLIATIANQPSTASLRAIPI